MAAPATKPAGCPDFVLAVRKGEFTGRTGDSVIRSARRAGATGVAPWDKKREPRVWLVFVDEAHPTHVVDFSYRGIRGHVHRINNPATITKRETPIITSS